MFKGHFYLFECDYCHEEIYVKHLPKTWVWIKTGVEGGQGHACEACKHLAPDGKAVAAGKLN